jgi:hemerythrin-like domain-containing protein
MAEPGDEPSSWRRQMDAFETLMIEHRLIERALFGLSNFAEQVRRKEETTGREDLAHFVSFIRGFADARHHGKEEDILFAAMVDYGFPKDSGPIKVMLREHDEGRAFVGILSALAEQVDPWSDDDRQLLVKAASQFVDLLSRHIQKEDNILYPMAESRLPPETLAQLNERCERFEETQAASADCARLQRLAEELIARYAPEIIHEGKQDPIRCCA